MIKVQLPKQTKIPRSRTESKSTREKLPQLKPSQRLVALQNFISLNLPKKVSDSIPVKDRMMPTSQAKRYLDENYIQMTSNRNTMKFNRKKANNQYMLVQQIRPYNSTKAQSINSSNINAYRADQYQGLRDYNEDRTLSCTNVSILGKSYNIFGVLDGHGGHSSCQFVKNNFVKCLEEEMLANPLLNLLQNLRRTIKKLQQKVIQLCKTKNLEGGTCASILIICENKYYISHIGDSRILAVQLSPQTSSYQQLTTDHKPEDKNERTRIQMLGGKVYRNKVKKADGEVDGPYRVFPGRLSVSRSIGDYEAKKQTPAVTWEPELLSGEIDQDLLFLIFSDGAFEKFSNSQIVDFFIKNKAAYQNQLRKSMESFLINCIIRETSDNVSLISISTKPIYPQ